MNVDVGSVTVAVVVAVPVAPMERLTVTVRV